MEKLDSTIYDIESIKRGYNSLFPNAYLEFLDKSSIGELEIGEYVERYMKHIIHNCGLSGCFGA